MLKPYSSDHSFVHTDAGKPLINFTPLNFSLLSIYSSHCLPPQADALSDSTLKMQASLWSMHGTLLMLPYINNFELQTPLQSYFLLLTRFLSSVYGTVWITGPEFLRVASYTIVCTQHVELVMCLWLWTWSYLQHSAIRNNTIINMAMRVPSGIPVEVSKIPGSEDTFTTLWNCCQKHTPSQPFLKIPVHIPLILGIIHIFDVAPPLGIQWHLAVAFTRVCLTPGVFRSLQTLVGHLAIIL